MTIVLPPNIYTIPSKFNGSLYITSILPWSLLALFKPTNHVRERKNNYHPTLPLSSPPSKFAPPVLFPSSVHHHHHRMMAKAVVTCTIIATALVFLILLPTSYRSPHYHKGNRKIRLSRCLGGLGPSKPLHFDPLLTKLEHKVEEKTLNNVTSNLHSNDMNDNQNHHHHGLPDYMHMEAQVVEAEIEEEDKVFFGDDGKLNLTLRLTILFPMIDNLPRDGYVGFRELEAWNIKQAKERLAFTTRKDLEARDKNKDGLISFKEYLPQFSDEDILKNNMEHGEAGWWMEQFKNADIDQDGHLNFEEFKDFLHPEDSISNVKVQEWLLREKIRRMDWDNDGKLSFREFRDNAYDTFKSYYQFSTGEDYVPSPEHQYADLDLNKDRVLTIQELKPIRHFLFPGELDYASYYTTYLMNEVDDNRDGKLTIIEILNHEDKFYKNVYAIEEEEEEDYHDEF